METHIKRRHAGAGRPIPKMPNAPLQSPANNWLGDFKSRYPNNFSSSSEGDPLDLQRNMKICPFCDQKSTRRWNLETHIKRRHAEAGRPIPKMPNAPLQSPANNWLGDLSKSTSPNSISPTSKDDPLGLFSTTNDHSPDLLRDIIEALGTIKEINQLRSYIVPGLNAVPLMNLDFSDGRTTLGYKGYVCEKCLSWQFQQIFDDEKITSLKSRHACDRQRLYDAQFVTDIPGKIHKRREELIFYLTIIANDIAKQQERVDLTAVEIHSSVFDNRSDSYEEYVDLDSLPSRTQTGLIVQLRRARPLLTKLI